MTWASCRSIFSTRFGRRAKAFSTFRAPTITRWRSSSKRREASWRASENEVARSRIPRPNVACRFWELFRSGNAGEIADPRAHAGDAGAGVCRDADCRRRRHTAGPLGGIAPARHRRTDDHGGLDTRFFVAHLLGWADADHGVFSPARLAAVERARSARRPVWFGPGFVFFFGRLASTDFAGH